MEAVIIIEEQEGVDYWIKPQCVSFSTREKHLNSRQVKKGMQSA